eukprot:m.338445 g.338445  ORF g.338445 m.338445 type:complete len:193 (-) comp18423_c0_seq1:141-719(-)
MKFLLKATSVVALDEAFVKLGSITITSISLFIKRKKHEEQAYWLLVLGLCFLFFSGVFSILYFLGTLYNNSKQISPCLHWLYNWKSTWKGASLVFAFFGYAFNIWGYFEFWNPDSKEYATTGYNFVGLIALLFDVILFYFGDKLITAADFKEEIDRLSIKRRLALKLPPQKTKKEIEDEIADLQRQLNLLHG